MCGVRFPSSSVFLFFDKHFGYNYCLQHSFHDDRGKMYLKFIHRRHEQWERQIRPGYSAKRYLSTWTRNWDDQVFETVVSKGQLRTPTKIRFGIRKTKIPFSVCCSSHHLCPIPSDDFPAKQATTKILIYFSVIREMTSHPENDQKGTSDLVSASTNNARLTGC